MYESLSTEVVTVFLPFRSSRVLATFIGMVIHKSKAHRRDGTSCATVDHADMDRSGLPEKQFWNDDELEAQKQRQLQQYVSELLTFHAFMIDHSPWWPWHSASMSGVPA